MRNIRMPREDRERAIDAVIAYFEKERGEAIGRLAAEALLDYVAEAVGPAIYNQALIDARAVLAERVQSLDDELYALEKRSVSKR